MSDGFRVVKRSTPFIVGPSTRQGMWEMDVVPLPPYEGIGDIADMMEDTLVPDFSLQHAQVASIHINIPDDPTEVGFADMKRLLSSVAEQFRLLSSYRCEVIGIKAEWVSLKTSFIRWLGVEKVEVMGTDGYKECKNVADRTAYIDDALSRFDDIDVAINQAIQRCTDFIELCRIKGKELDRCMTALSSQIAIIKLQVKLGFIQPVRVDEDS